jgi:FkbM family methyltransferase
MSAEALLEDSRRLLRETLAELAARAGEPAGEVADDLVPARILELSDRLFRDDAEGMTALLAGRRVALPVTGGLMFVDLGEWTSWIVLRVRGWEVAIGQLLAKLVGPGDVAIDVGAHTGGHTLAMAAAMRGQGRIYACEPLPANVELLRRTVTVNRLDYVVTVLPVALGETAGTATLHGYRADAATPRYPGESSMLHSLVPMRDYGSDGVEVAVATLDALVEARALRAVHLIKLDVEGAELMILRGGSRLLGGRGRMALVVEVHPTELAALGASPGDVIDLLRGHGFELFHLVPEGDRLAPRALAGRALAGDHVIARRR